MRSTDSNPIKILPSAEGYSLDLRPPRWDQIAVDYSNLIFGSKTVSGILKKYHRSRVSIDALQSDVFEYNCKLPSRPLGDAIYIAALQSVRKEFVPQIPIVPLTIGAASQVSTVPKDKSPGLPWKLEGYKTKEDVFSDEEAMRRIRRDWILIGRGYHVRLPDCLVYARAQVCDPTINKVRATWGYPAGVFIEEARYVYPYLDFLKHRKDDYPLAYGVEMGKGGMGYVDEMYHRAGAGAKAVMMDWKRFDKQVPAWLVRDAFAILKECFRTDVVVDVEGKVWPVNPQITNARWSKMVQYFINTPFRMPDGSRYMKSHGVPSGSCFTNVVDSIINAIVTRYCVYQTTGSLPWYDLYMGDDSVLMVRGVVNLDDIASVACSVFGFTLNIRKSYVTSERTNIQFLGYYNDSGYPIRDQDFLIASFCLPERVAPPDPIFTAVRAVGQMWSTLNGIAAQRWLLIIKGIEKEYGLSPSWFVDHMRDKPNSLKFLRLHGLNANTFPQPQEFDQVVAPMRPPFRPMRRTPVRRVTDVKDLYFQYIDDPVCTEEFVTSDVEEDETFEPPDDSNC